MEQKSPYLLRHRADDHAEDLRLNKQFFVSKAELYGGHDIPPLILARQPHLKAVADIGCGTAVWLRDVSRTYFADASAAPSLIGWDLNPAASSGQNEAYEGLQVFKHDCTKPIDPKWHGQFDLVHMGSMAYAIGKDGWAGVLDNVQKLLKSGGFLLWRDTENKNFVPIDGPPEMTRALELWSEERKIRGLVTDMPRHMVSSVMFAKDADDNPLYEVEDFHLNCVNTPESLARDGVKRHDGSDELVLIATKAILQGRLLRHRQEAAEPQGDQKEHIQELEHLDKFLAKAIQEKSISFRCGFPHLIARKL